MTVYFYINFLYMLPEGGGDITTCVLFGFNTSNFYKEHLPEESHHSLNYTNKKYSLKKTRLRCM